MKQHSKPDAIAMMSAMKSAAAAPPAMTETPPRQNALTRKPGARAGTRQIAGHFSVGTLKALKHIMAEEDATLQALLDEAIQDLLVKKGRTKLVVA